MKCQLFSDKELEKGINVELEHTKDRKKAETFAREHLEKVPDYYTRLEKMLDTAKKEKPVKQCKMRMERKSSIFNKNSRF